jgi:hypothetical protein
MRNQISGQVRAAQEKFPKRKCKLETRVRLSGGETHRWIVIVLYYLLLSSRIYQIGDDVRDSDNTKPEWELPFLLNSNCPKASYTSSESAHTTNLRNEKKEKKNGSAFLCYSAYAWNRKLFEQPIYYLAMLLKRFSSEKKICINL